MRMKCNSKIKMLRLQAGMSQNKLASRAELDRNTVRNAENGLPVSELTVYKLSHTLSELLEQPVNPNELADYE